MIPLADDVPRHRLPVATWALILVNTLVFFFEVALPERQLETLFYLLGIVPARYAHPDWAHQVGFPAGDYLPFLTSMFLHGGWIHLLGNMWTLWIFGDNVEDRMGTVRYVAFYLVCGIGSAVVHTVFNTESTVPAVGASGAIAGVLGAYLFLFPRARILGFIPIFFYPLFFELPAFFYLYVWFLTQFLSGTLALTAEEAGAGIAWWAHIGGFVLGAILFALFLEPKRSRRSSVSVHGW